MAKEISCTLNVEQQEMVGQHLDLVSIILRKYINTNEQIRGLEHDDLYQCGCLALCKAAYHYDGRVKFETFARIVIRNALLDECRKTKTVYSKQLSYDAPVHSDDDDGDCFTQLLQDSYTIDDSIFCEELMNIVRNAKKTHKGAVLKGIEAIELRIKGYTGAEIARLNRHPFTIYYTLYRANNQYCFTKNERIKNLSTQFHSLCSGMLFLET